MSLAALKKQSDFSSLIDEYNKQTTPQETKSFADDRIWKPELDKSGNGYAVIRFLPAPDGEDKTNIKPRRFIDAKVIIIPY